MGMCCLLSERGEGECHRGSVTVRRTQTEREGDQECHASIPCATFGLSETKDDQRERNPDVFGRGSKTLAPTSQGKRGSKMVVVSDRNSGWPSHNVTAATTYVY